MRFWKYEYWHQSSSSFPDGGNGAIPGGAHNNSNERKSTLERRTKRHDGTVKPALCRFWIKPQTFDFHDFSYFVAVGSFTVDGCKQ